MTSTGRKILMRMMKTYKDPKKAKRIFYAMEAEGKLTPKATSKSRKRKRARRKK